MEKESTGNWIRALLLAAAIILLPAMPARAEAAASKKSLSMNKTYTNYDVTNDGKKDTLLLTPTGYSSGFYSGLKISVNGETAYSLKGMCVYDFSASLLTLSNSKAFLWVNGAGDNGDGTNILLQYSSSSGKFKKIADLESVFSRYGTHIYSRVKSVEGKKIVLNVHTVSASLGCISFDTTYTYKSGTLKQSNVMSSCKVLYAGKKHNTLTANRNLTVYASKTLSGKKYTIKKGQTVKVTGFYLKDSKFLIKMNVNGNARWMAFLKKFPSEYLFSDVYYAG